jgi:chromosome segregation ATPase
MSPTSYQTAPPRVVVEQVGYPKAASAHNAAPMPLFRRTAPPDPRVAQLTTDVAALRAQLAELESRLSSANARLDEVSSALTSQLHELSGELESSHRAVDQRVNALDSLTAGRLAATEKAHEERLAAFRAELEALLADRGNGDTETDAATATVRLEELLERQTRIANEVARHEIAFQQELAALADRLGRNPPRH